jgi:DNA-directed RNA polymerase subunit H (RpoH/RPB5)
LGLETLKTVKEYIPTKNEKRKIINEERERLKDVVITQNQIPKVQNIDYIHDWEKADTMAVLDILPESEIGDTQPFEK